MSLVCELCPAAAAVELVVAVIVSGSRVRGVKMAVSLCLPCEAVVNEPHGAAITVGSALLANAAQAGACAFSINGEPVPGS